MENEIVQLLGLEFTLVSFQKPKSEMLGIIRTRDLVNISKKDILVVPLWVNGQISFGEQFTQTGSMQISSEELTAVFEGFEGLKRGGYLPRILETLPNAIEKIKTQK